MYGRPYSTGQCWLIGGETRLSLLMSLLVCSRILFLLQDKQAEGQIPPEM